MNPIQTEYLAADRIRSLRAEGTVIRVDDRPATNAPTMRVIATRLGTVIAAAVATIARR